MNFKKINLKNIFSNSESIHKRGLYSPHRDWMIIIVIFFVLLILSIGVHSGLYFLVEKGSIFNETAEEEIFSVALRRDLIDEVVKSYEAKDLNSGENSVILRDPSNF